MIRRQFITLLGGAAVWPLPVRAQQARRLPVIGVLVASPLHTIKPRVEAFRQGLRELGYVEQQNVVIEWRSAEGQLDRLPALASELVQLKVDIIVAAGGEPPAVAAKRATQGIPIVMVNVGDPVGTGLVSSLGRPGGNITGLSTTAGPGIYGKKLALLKEAIPSLSRVALTRTIPSVSWLRARRRWRRGNSGRPCTPSRHVIRNKSNGLSPRQ